MTTKTETETKKVYAAISKATAILASKGVGKNAKNQAQGFGFRKIDDVMDACSLALVEAKLVVLPRYIDRVVTERTTAKGGLMLHTVLTAEFDFVSAEDGSMHTLRAYGEAADSGDKSTNKAFSAAFKYILTQAFCVPFSAQEDPDAESPEFNATEEKNKGNAQIETKGQAKESIKETTIRPVAYLSPEFHPRIKQIRYLFPTDHPRIDEVREFAKDHGFSCSTIGSVVNVVADKEIAPWAKFLVQGGTNG